MLNAEISEVEKIPIPDKGRKMYESTRELAKDIEACSGAIVKVEFEEQKLCQQMYWRMRSRHGKKVMMRGKAIFIDRRAEAEE